MSVSSRSSSVFPELVYTLYGHCISIFGLEFHSLQKVSLMERDDLCRIHRKRSEIETNYMHKTCIDGNRKGREIVILCPIFF